jgi:DNA recombination protein RmuC
MVSFTLPVTLIAGILLGALAVWLILRERATQAREAGRLELAADLAALQERIAGRDRQIEAAGAALERSVAEMARLRTENAELQARLAQLTTRLEEERKAAAEKFILLDEARTKLADAFKALSAEALSSNNQAFLHLAKSTLERFQEGARGDLDSRQQAIGQLVGPLKEALDKVDVRIHDLERARTGAYARLDEQLKSLLTTQLKLESETSSLLKALRTPTVRGRWGEIQLRRVVEMAGMLAYCDFAEQESTATEEGRLRPDMLVKLPNAKSSMPRPPCRPTSRHWRRRTRTKNGRDSRTTPGRSATTCRSSRPRVTGPSSSPPRNLSSSFSPAKCSSPPPSSRTPR